jgi:glycosyltransferase involved in cell wall biosynthesis
VDAPHDYPTIAVALCTHNGSRFIAEQLESILGQDYPATRVVISDDDSRDDTVAIVESTFRDYLAAHPTCSTELTLVKNVPALGIVENFQQAIRASTADLVALSDQDDVWDQGRLGAIARVFATRADLTLLHGDAVLIDGAGKVFEQSLLQALGVRRWELRAIAAGEAERVLIRRNLATGATVVFRRALVDVALPVPVGWIHDEWLAMVASVTGQVDVDRRKFVGYRQHGQNQIGATTLTFATRMDRLRQPRTARNARLLLRAHELVTRLEMLGGSVADSTVDLARGKLAHEEFRSALPRRRLARVIPVLSSAVRGRYWRFGLGAQDVLRDIVQPV